MKKIWIALVVMFAVGAMAQGVFGPVQRVKQPKRKKVEAAAPSGWTDTNTYLAIWDFEHTNGVDLLDTSGNNITMTNNNGVTYQVVSASPSKHSALFVSASSQDFKCGNKIFNALTQVSVFAWAKINPDNQSYGTVVGELNSAQGICGIQTALDKVSPVIELVNASSYASGIGADVTTNVWHFLAIRWTKSAASTGELYVDNVYVTNCAFNATLATDRPTCIGNYNFLTRYFGGEICFVGILPAYVTTSAMTDFYNNTNPTNYLRQ